MGCKVREAEAGPGSRGAAAIACSGGWTGFIQMDTASQHGHFWLWCGGQSSLGTALIHALVCSCLIFPPAPAPPPPPLFSPFILPPRSSLPLSHLPPLLLPVPGTASPQNRFVPLQALHGLHSRPSVQLWEGAPPVPARFPPAARPGSALPPLGLLVSVSKVTPTASRSSLSSQRGFPTLFTSWVLFLTAFPSSPAPFCILPLHPPLEGIACT